MPKTDLEEHLRGTLHAWLDPAQPTGRPELARRPRFRAAPAGAFGLVGIAIVLVALLAAPRSSPGPAVPGAPTDSSPGRSAGIFAAGGAPGTVQPDAAPTASGAGPAGTAVPGTSDVPEAIPSASGGAATIGITVAPPSAAATPKAARPSEGPAGTPVPVRRTPPPSVVPLATPGPTTVASAAPATTVTLADNGSVVTLSVGQMLTLQLGAAYEWSVNIANPALLVPAPEATAAQPAFIAAAPGVTRLVAAGDPPCRHSKPACGVPSIVLEITVVVR